MVSTGIGTIKQAGKQTDVCSPTIDKQENIKGCCSSLPTQQGGQRHQYLPYFGIVIGRATKYVSVYLFF